MEPRTKVYLATPDNTLARMIRRELQGRGYRLQEAMDWSFVPEEVGLFGADLVLLASELPDIGTDEVLRSLKADPRTASRPVIVLLPAFAEDAVQRLLDAGADDYLCARADGSLDPVELVERLRIQAEAASAPLPEIDVTTPADETHDQARVPDPPAVRSQHMPTVAESLPAGTDGYYEDDMLVVIEVAEALASSLPPNDALFVLTRRLAAAIPVFRCAVVVKSVKPGEAIVVASHDDADLTHRPIELSRYPEVTACLERGQEVLVEDVQNDPMYEGVYDFITAVDLGSALVVPLFVREVPVATLTLTTRRETHGFTRRELLLVRALGHLAAGILSVTDLVEEVRREAATEKPLPAELDDLILGIEDQIEGLIEELERK